jgi:hypothetical protein
MPSFRQVASADAPNSSLPSREMIVTAAPTRAAATAWFEPLPPGPILKPEPAIVSPIPGMRPARNARSATKMPRMATPRLPVAIVRVLRAQPDGARMTPFLKTKQP